MMKRVKYGGGSHLEERFHKYQRKYLISLEYYFRVKETILSKNQRLNLKIRLKLTMCFSRLKRRLVAMMRQNGKILKNKSCLIRLNRTFVLDLSAIVVDILVITN